MANNQVSTALLQLTGNLSATTGSTKKQLVQLRKELAAVLPLQPMEQMMAPASKKYQRLFAGESFLQEEAKNAINEFVGKIETALPAEDLSPEMKVFRREVPVRSSQLEGSVPQWAAGQKVDHTLGPFMDNFGEQYWFDFYRRVRYVTIARGSAIFLQIPFMGLLFAKQQYNLPAGSIWIRSQLLTSWAPGGAYTGLKIKGGKIIFSNPVTISGNSIMMDSTGGCELSLELDQPADTPALDTTTGEDAKNAAPQLPVSVQITCTPGSASITEAADMRLHLYGSNYTFTKTDAAPVFEPLLNRILVPFKGDTDVCSVPTVKSSLFEMSGSAAILHTAWALPVTLAAVSQLGEAAGIGAIALKVKPGFRAGWPGLEKGPVKLNEAYLMSEPGRISLTAMNVSSRNGRQKFELWEEKNATKKIHSALALQFAQEFVLVYNSLSSGHELVWIKNAALRATLDRPVSADKRRLKINAPRADVILAEIKNERFVSVQGKDILQQLHDAKQTDDLSPISFALSNALIKTTPVDDFFLFGKWLTPNEIKEGTVTLNCPMYFLFPTLPDPYVTNFNPLASLGRRVAAFSAQSLTAGTSGMGLMPVVQWTEAVNPKLSFFFVPDPTNANLFIGGENPNFPEEPKPAATLSDASGDTGSEARAADNEIDFSSLAFSRIQINRTREIQAEDAANAASLRSIFYNSLQLAQEQIYLLDVSTNADLFGVGLRINTERNRENTSFPLAVNGIDLVTNAAHTRVYTLPQIQWEPLWTIQNPDVTPHPFPSPATSPDTGDPTIMGTMSYKLVPIAPKPVIEKFLSEYNDPADPQKLAMLFSLPFGMNAAALLDNAKDPTNQGARVSYNQPAFDKQKVKGGLQITMMATSPESGPDAESPGFKGATIQTRNLIDLLTGTIPLDEEGKPLSVLGPVVDTIFNGEFKPADAGGANPRVPLERMDLSGYGATIFSNWLNPRAQIAATSQAKFDVLIGRTSHEVIQVKSILYPWGVAVVRTITIQRTSGGGVTRHDSGWKAQGPGLYDFSYTDTAKVKHLNPYEFHPGVVKGMYHVTAIRDTGRIYRKPENPTGPDDVILQEVFFNGDVLIEDVKTGVFNGFVPSTKQRGFVQLSPYQKPLTPQQFFDLLVEEGPLGGPVDCMVDVGRSGQPMRIIQVNVNGTDNSGSKIFVSAGHGSLLLPKEGSWSLVKRKENTKDIITIDQDRGLPLIREEKIGSTTTNPYRFSDPIDIVQSGTPVSDYGILHSTGSQKTLFVRPTIQRNDTNIKSSFRPFFADSFAVIQSSGVFPNLDTTFQLGNVTGTNLQIIGPGKLKLTSGGNFKAPIGFTRDMVKNGTSRIYVDYSDAAGSGDTAEITYFFDSEAATPWYAKTKNHSLVVDLLGFNSLVTVSTEFDAQFGQLPRMPKPKTKFGSILQPIVDMLSFLGGQDISHALAVSMSNTKTTSWQPKLQGVLNMEIEYKTFAPPKLPEFEVKVLHTNLKGEPPIPIEKPKPEPLPVLILGCEIALKAYFNMRPQKLTIKDSSGSPATTEEMEAASVDMISSGATLEIEGSIHVLFYTITPNVAGIYFIGILGFEFGLDSKEGKSFGFKVAVGLEVRAQWPIVGEVSVMMAIGLAMEWSDSGSGVFAIFIFKGEADLLGGIVIIGIAIEAKGGQEKEITDGVTETFAVCEVTFAAEVSLAFVINIEFSETWQERKQCS